MKIQSFLLATLSIGLVLALALLTNGCSTKSRDDSELPWATPATWEGQLPGIGSGGG